MRQLTGLQYLRAVAAIAVVVFHAAQRAGASFLVGEAGVDLFFLISGFLMVAITSQETRPHGFMAARIKRIVPAYWIATSVFLAGALIGLFPNARLDPWHVSSSYLFLPDRGPGMTEIWPLLVPGWTLNYEMFFYAVFTLTLALPFGARVRTLALSAVLLGLVALGACFRPQAAAARFYTDPILLEFLAGAWLALYWKLRGPPPGEWIAVAAGGLLFVGAWWLNDDSWRVVVYGVPALLLLVGVLGIEHRHGFGQHRVLKLAGDASYSIYLWHTMILAVTTKAAGVLGFATIPTIAIGILASIVGGVIAYRCIEVPFQVWFKRRRALTVAVA
jgi:exopolysaccharide production protein ExoZ